MGAVMRRLNKIQIVASAFLFLSSFARAATVTGVVRGPDGAPVEGAFVQAQNSQTNMSFIVLSDGQGRYRLERIPAGQYRVQIRAVGYRTDARSGVSLTTDQNASFDFALKEGTVRWSDLSIDQARILLPPNAGKDLLFKDCFICHGFQTRMAAVPRDLDGWKDRVQYMREAMRFGVGWRVTDPDANELATYLDSVFGSDATIPKSPTTLPGYKDTLLKLGNDASKIVYVEYDMPGPSRMPFSAAPGKDGYLWIPDFGVANKITRLDPKTGAMEDFPVPNAGTAGIHSAVEAPDGSVWLTEQASNKLGRWDPQTKQITEYQDPYLEGKEGIEPGGSKHTVRFDPHGNAWATGDPLSRFDRETGKFTNYWETGRTYSLTNDSDGNIWFTIIKSPGQIAKMDWQTLKITRYAVPTKDGSPHRIQIGSKGIIWFTEYDSGKLGRLDPQTGTFEEYDLPTGPLTHPYAVGIDAEGDVWYSSYYFDVLGRFSPSTGKITQYPFPHSENTIREFFLDTDGRMWYGSPSNNKVGYFYLTDSRREATRGGH
jgi:virginiamycin B lyase